ncbi:hypothetical protein ACIF6L_18615 [Kitasatospora sp. NPDC086009]|uniref:hypothetical protein n=1 Tax=unclassified Kitasatospora TaxID=2633591 RepID=UPI0036E94606
MLTNAAKSGCRLDMTVTVRRITAATVRISVRDGSRSLPVLIRASADDESHHRLTGGRWGVTIEPFDKVVHADVSQ